MNTYKTGTVYLVGGGPGDPDLITVKGLSLLQRADAVLYDALVNPALLEKVPDTAELIYVGKRAGHHHLSQTEINERLVTLARKYQTVVRLKGGDPFVFGRGGEELAHVRAAGIRCEVVPGISSAIGALAYAGIPITHRNLGANFAVVTGHRAKDPANETNWAALAQLDTLVILMGVTNLPNITAQLMAAGRDANTPAAAIQWGTLPEQTVVKGSLSTLAVEVLKAKLKPPAVIVIGAVASLADSLNWYENPAEPLGIPINLFEGEYSLPSHAEVILLPEYS